MVSPDVLVFVCANCTPMAQSIPRQWLQEELTVQLKVFPCSGKIDIQYIMHALEGGIRGICLLTCAEGQCCLAEGNLRASVRIATAKRLMEEIGLDPDVLIMKRCDNGASSTEKLKALVSDAVACVAAKPSSPLLSN